MIIAMVMGGAVTLPNDVKQFTQSHVYHRVVACNEAGIWWKGNLDCWSTLHPEKMGRWLKTRLDSGANMPRVVNVVSSHRHNHARELESEYKIKVVQTPASWGKGSGSSGLFALKAAFELCGAEKAVLCGVPLTRTRNFFRADKGEWPADAYRKAWGGIPPHISSNIRSMSGWTKNVFGAPDDFPVRGLDTAARQC